VVDTLYLLKIEEEKGKGEKGTILGEGFQTE